MAALLSSFHLCASYAMAFRLQLRVADVGSETDSMEPEGTAGDRTKEGRTFTRAEERKVAAGGALHRCVEFDGMLLTVTDGDEVAEVAKDGALHVLGGESYVEGGTGTRQHFVDVQGDREAMVLFVSVREDECRIVSIRRFS